MEEVLSRITAELSYVKVGESSLDGVLRPSSIIYRLKLMENDRVFTKVEVVPDGNYDMMKNKEIDFIDIVNQLDSLSCNLNSKIGIPE